MRVEGRRDGRAHDGASIARLGMDVTVRDDELQSLARVALGNLMDVKHAGGMRIARLEQESLAKVRMRVFEIRVDDCFVREDAHGERARLPVLQNDRPLSALLT